METFFTERLDAALAEVRTQALRAHANNTEFDRFNSVNDFIAYTIAYLGRATEQLPRNETDGINTRDMLKKAAGLVVTCMTLRT